jgi:hypothetical protein
MKKKFSVKTTIIFFLLIIVSLVFLVQCHKTALDTTAANTNNKTAAVADSLAFGDTKWISDGLKGKIYLLPENTDKLPDFDTMNAVGTLYTHTLDIPNRSWETGFPGVPNRFEWFAIEYKGNFRVQKPGHYSFRMVSDDGAKLFIDGKKVIDNDGLHPASSASGEANIDGGNHSITVQYYQGPRYYIALQLFATFDKEEEQVFPGNNFMLTTPTNGNAWVYIIIICVLVVVAIYVYIRKGKIFEVVNA